MKRKYSKSEETMLQRALHRRGIDPKEQTLQPTDKGHPVSTCCETPFWEPGFPKVNVCSECFAPTKAKKP